MKDFYCSVEMEQAFDSFLSQNNLEKPLEELTVNTIEIAKYFLQRKDAAAPYYYAAYSCIPTKNAIDIWNQIDFTFEKGQEYFSISTFAKLVTTDQRVIASHMLMHKIYTLSKIYLQNDQKNIDDINKLMVDANCSKYQSHWEDSLTYYMERLGLATSDNTIENALSKLIKIKDQSTQLKKLAETITEQSLEKLKHRDSHEFILKESTWKALNISSDERLSLLGPHLLPTDKTGVASQVLDMALIRLLTPLVKEKITEKLPEESISVDLHGPFTLLVPKHMWTLQVKKEDQQS